MHPSISPFQSRRRLLQLAGQGAISLALLSGCGASAAPTPTAQAETLPTQAPPSTPAAPTPSPTADSSQPSLATKLGQMLMVGFRGLAVDEQHPIVRDIIERQLGGVVLFNYDVIDASFTRNIDSPEQVRRLIEDLQSFTHEPLLVAMDQEGGIVSRLQERYGFPATLSHAALGQLGDPTATYEHAEAMARTLAEVGVNLNLAPVVDLNTNPQNPVIAAYERSFGADPQLVRQHAQAFIEAHHAHGVLCTLKHFPGHGSSTADSHQGFVDVTQTWSRQELAPYQALINSGLVDAIMTAHVFNATLDPDNPATLSHATLTGLLRGELGYDGVIISDDMQMAAIRADYGFETAIQKTLEAGVDIIAVGNNLLYEEDIASRAIVVMHHLVESGVISTSRIDASYQRIQRLKESIGLQKTVAK